MTTEQIIDDLKKAIIADPLSVERDGKGPIDHAVVKAESDPKVLDAYKSFITSKAFIEFAAQSAETAHSCQHVARRFQLGGLLDSSALRRHLKSSKDPATRVMLLFMLRDRGALPSFVEFAADTEIQKSAPHAWIDLTAGLVTPAKLCQLMKDGIKHGGLPPRAVIFAFPRLRTTFGNEFVPLMRQLVDGVPHAASKLISDALNGRYDIGTNPVPPSTPHL